MKKRLGAMEIKFYTRKLRTSLTKHVNKDGGLEKIVTKWKFIINIWKRQNPTLRHKFHQRRPVLLLRGSILRKTVEASLISGSKN